MLIRFGVENFLSFRDRVEISMAATRFSDAPALTFPTPGVEHGLLPVMAIYGANASGKSNLFAAFTAMRNEVVGSYSDRKPDAEIPYQPFLLEPACSEEPSSVDVDFTVEGVRHHYGFRWTAQRIEEEWLYAFPRNRQQVWFHRKATESPAFYFGENLKGKKRMVAELTRPNTLFLSSAAQHNLKQLLPIYRWFSSGLFRADDIRMHAMRVYSSKSALLAADNAQVVRELLQAADLGVVNFRAKKNTEIHELLTAMSDDDGVPGDVRSRLRENLERDPPLSIELAHQIPHGEPVFFKPQAESRGTQLFLSLTDRMLSVLKAGGTLFVDELDAGLHPQLSARLLEIFTSPASNPNGAQLVFSTHDESLLDHLRRDSVVFTEKDSDGSTRIVSLAEFKTRKRDDIRRGYGEGRFGGVPILGDMADVAAGRGEG